jgi:uncharacterized phage protein (TIGR01671 family)
MRKIKFRGVRQENEMIISGNLRVEQKSFQEDKIFIDNYVLGCYQIKPETLGQFTGATDINGKNIYEGDIVKSATWSADKKQLVDVIGVVEFEDSCFWVNYKENDVRLLHRGYNKQVIGNIHENLELLKA